MEFAKLGLPRNTADHWRHNLGGATRKGLAKETIGLSRKAPQTTVELAAALETYLEKLIFIMGD
jgi:hypothetical protein